VLPKAGLLWKQTEQRRHRYSSTTGLLGQIDAPALDEVRAHLAAIGGAAWEGMQAVGTS